MASASSVGSSILSKLTVGNFFLALSVYIAFRVVYQIVYYRFFHPLFKFPGPFWGSVTRLWVAYHNVKEDECELEYALHKKYGTALAQTA